MIVQGESVGRVGWCALTALAALLTVWCIVSMASAGEDGDRLEALMDRYAPRQADKTAEKPKTGKAGTSESKNKPTDKTATGKKDKKDDKAKKDASLRTR